MIQMRLCAACLSTKQFCRQKGVVLQQMTKQVNCRRLRAPASGRALVRPEETSRAQASQKRIWQLVANQNTGTNTRTQCCQERERESTDPAARSRLSQRGWSMALERVQSIHHQSDATKIERPLHDELVRRTRCETSCNLRSARRNSTRGSEQRFRKKNDALLCERAIQ